MMLKPKERERSEALTTTKHKQPGAGKQFTSRSLRGARRTTHSELLGSTWALPRSNGSPAAYRSDVIFLSDILLNKVANDHTRESSEGFKANAAPLAWVCPSGLPPGGGGPASGRRRQRPCPAPGALRDRGAKEAEAAAVLLLLRSCGRAGGAPPGLSRTEAGLAEAAEEPARGGPAVRAGGRGPSARDSFWVVSKDSRGKSDLSASLNPSLAPNTHTRKPQIPL